MKGGAQLADRSEYRRAAVVESSSGEGGGGGAGLSGQGGEGGGGGSGSVRAWAPAEKLALSEELYRRVQAEPALLRNASVLAAFRAAPWLLPRWAGGAGACLALQMGECSRAR